MTIQNHKLTAQSVIKVRKYIEKNAPHLLKDLGIIQSHLDNVWHSEITEEEFNKHGHIYYASTAS